MKRVFARIPGHQRRYRYGRRKVLLALATALGVGLLALADRSGLIHRQATPDVERYDQKTFRVVHVVDGDTMDIDLSDLKTDKTHTRIRLWGVDTPEVHGVPAPQHFGPEASQFTKDAILDKTVRLELDPRDTRDKYNRLLAYVFLSDGTLLNEELVRQGYAYADPRFEHRRKSLFERLQREARKTGRGLWAAVTEADLPEYYRGKIKRSAAESTR